MFYISNLQGIQTLYTPAAVTPSRIQEVAPISGISAQPATPGIAEQFPNGEQPLKQPPKNRNPYSRLDQPAPQREPAIVAAQIMSSDVITLKVTDTVEHAWKLFHQRHFRHVPVMSEDGKLIGIISDRDFLALGLDHVGRELNRAEQLSSPIKNIMKSDVLTTRPTTEIRAIARIMFTENIGAMPVVEEEGALVGILTTNDILRTLVNNAPLGLWI